MLRGKSLDERYYEVVSPGSIAERLALRARDRMYVDFMQQCEPEVSSTLLDVGASDVITAAANFIERLYPYPQQITAAGLSAAPEFKVAFPTVSYVEITANQALPFPDGHFSIAMSNAVLEHVGSGEHQRRFVAELMRVGRQVFITVPHRYFPVEHHTGIPLLHYWDTSFEVSCRLLQKDLWSKPENLILMTAQRLRELVPAGCRAEIGTTGLRLGPFSSNLFLHIKH